MSTPLSHVLSVGITTILIVGLMTGASGFLEDQSERTARQELETIGNRLAGDLDRVDTLGREGDNVTLTSRHADKVAGSTYTVRLRNGTAVCDSVPTDTCLRLSATEYDHEAVVPVNNRTTLDLQERESGQFRIHSSGGTANPQVPTRSLDLSGRVGIGGDVGTGPPIGVGTSLEQKPIAQFTFRPGQPETSSPITFDAGGSTDPDGSIDEYAWDFDNDGTFEETGLTSPTTDHTFATAGWQNVTLEVTDNSGSTSTYSREMRVSGLVYNNDLQEVTPGADNVTFTVTNEHAQPIVIERVLIDPDSNSLSEISEYVAGDFHEIEVDGSTDGYVDFSTLTIPEDGAIVDLDADGHSRGSDVLLTDGDTARVTLQYFHDDVSGEDFTFGVRYRFDDKYNANVFNGTVPP